MRRALALAGLGSVRLTGRYQFKPGFGGRLHLHVEETNGGGGFGWRPAKKSDIKALGPEVADGWRFREERGGLDDVTGKRYRSND
jgi:hypothetical protein